MLATTTSADALDRWPATNAPTHLELLDHLLAFSLERLAELLEKRRRCFGGSVRAHELVLRHGCVPYFAVIVWSIIFFSPVRQCSTYEARVWRQKVGVFFSLSTCSLPPQKTPPLRGDPLPDVKTCSLRHQKIDGCRLRCD
jgi:hypothetical protein